jgi:hypothetical protein
MLRKMRLPHRQPVRRPTVLAVEELEPRRAPAVLVNAHTVTFTDVDGDQATVKTSRGTFSLAQFTFAASGVGEQLQQLDLHDQPAFAGAKLTITAKPAAGGDGFVNVGAIIARDFGGGVGIDLGAVTVQGDLGRITAGDSTTATRGLKALAVQSLGHLGTATQAAGGSLESDILGALGSLQVNANIEGALVFVQGGADGQIGKVTIGGSLIGGDGVGSGEIFALGDLGPVRIAGDVRGGAGGASGVISAGGQLVGITIGGSLIGGGEGSGKIFALGDLGPVRIAGDVRGGAGESSGVIWTSGLVVGITIGGSLIGGGGRLSGHVEAGSGVGPVRIAGVYSGSILTPSQVARVTIGGSLIGAGGFASGEIFPGGGLGPVTVQGNVQGGAGDFSGSFLANNNVARFTIGGSLIGGGGRDSGRISTLGELGPVRIAGDVRGGAGESSGMIGAGVGLAGVRIGGSLIGGGGDVSGAIRSQFDIGRVSIGGDIQGGSVSGTASVNGSGFIQGQRLAKVVIGGSVIAGSNTGTGTLNDSGAILAVNDIGSISVGDSLVGNSTNPVLISARGQAAPAPGRDLAIGQLTVAGRVDHALILAGYDTSTSPSPFGQGVNADAQIGTIRVGGDWIASSVAAGAAPGAHGFGSGDSKLSGSFVTDAPRTLSRICSIVIAGQAQGTVGGSDSFGFVAERVGSLRVGGTLIGLTRGPHNDHGVLVGATGDLFVDEV